MFDVQPAAVVPVLQDAIRLEPRPLAAKPAQRLHAVVLLAGSVGSQSLASAAGRSAAGFPVDRSSTILCHWRRQLESFAGEADRAPLPLRVIETRGSLRSFPESAHRPVRVSFEHDDTELRGPGGVARDAVQQYPDEARVLVAAAAQLVTADLSTLLWQLLDSPADVVVTTFDDRSPADMLLIRCGCLRELPATGFVDLKEQGLALIARRHRVQVVSMPRRIFHPVRTRATYIRALRAFHRNPNADNSTSPFDEDWEPIFSLAEPGALVDPRARLHDSVVFAGGVVESGAVLVRSVVCPGGVVRRNQLVTEAVISGKT